MRHILEDVDRSTAVKYHQGIRALRKLHSETEPTVELELWFLLYIYKDTSFNLYIQTIKL